MLATAVLDFDYSSESEPEQIQRLGVSGELDAETAPSLSDGLRGTGAPVTHLRLDLSGITFIDCSGLSALLAALDEARSAGWVVEVDERISAPVRRIVQMTRTGDQIWPRPPGTAGPA